jgi:hypothetical protein
LVERSTTPARSSTPLKSDRGRVYRIDGGGKPGVIEPDTTDAQRRA